MINIQDVPAPAVPSERAARDIRLLQELATGGTRLASTRRRGTVIALAAVGFTGVTAAAAYTVLKPEAATVTDSARCYATVSTARGDSFPGTTISVAPPVGQPRPSTPEQAISICAVLWQRGFLTPAGFRAPEVPRGPDGLPPATNPVPPLVACVLPGGQAAVYPGPETVCDQLGLPLLAP